MTIDIELPEDIEIPEIPKGFKQLCQNLGLAILLSQKTHFALAHYYSFFGIVNWNWGKEVGR